jgi:DNA-binding SARP family transcriptional activator/predicted ATPase
MSCELQIQLLGAPQITLHSTPLHFGRRKALALLAYLASTHRPHTRDMLAALLTTATNERLARQQLRNALHELTARLGAYLQVTPQTLALPASPAVAVDTDMFEAGVSAALTAADPEALEQAIKGYGGEFMAGFYLRDTPDFEEWLLLERERLRSLLLNALQHLVNLRDRRNELAAAIATARQLLALEPYHEQIHRQLMELFARNGQPDLALAQYEECQRILAVELGLAPSAATRALYEQLRAPAGIPPHNLPLQAFPIVGRSSELAWLIQQLADPECRVITVVGLGGSGKTRLALEAAAHYIQPKWSATPSPFLDGIYLIDLATRVDPTGAEPTTAAAHQIATAIAAAVGLVFHGAGDAESELKHALQQQRLLLLLDSAEDLASGSAYLADLIAYAPALKLLVTSRAPLQIQAEWRLELEGLPVPATADELETAEASRLFLAQARRHGPTLELTPPEQEALVQLCRMLQGLPLGLVLAANWTRTLRVSELVAELNQSLDLLNATIRDLPARQQSIRTVLDWSWQRLTPALSSILRQAAVFRGDYDHVAARAVLNAGLLQLHMLCDSGLLSRGPAGRYRLHDLVRQYGAEQLAAYPTEAEQVRIRHAVYYAGLAAPIALNRHPHRAALTQVAAEFANFELAWTWAVREGRGDLLSQLLPTLSTWLDLKGLFQTGLDLFGAAVAQIRQAHPDGLAAHSGLLLIELAHFHARLGQFDQMRPALQAALTLTQASGAHELTARVHYYRGMADYYQGLLSSALQTLAEALDLAESAGADRLRVDILRALGQIDTATANYEQAGAWFAEALTQARQLDMPRHVAAILADQGDLAFYALNYAIARARHEESLQVSHELDDRAVIPRTLVSLGQIASVQGDVAAARAHFATGLAMARKTGNIHTQARCLNGLGVIAMQQNDVLAARALLEEAERLTRLIGDKEGIAHALIALASTYVETGDPQRYQPLLEEALALMRAVSNFRGIASVLNNMGLAALSRGDYAQAAPLLEESLGLHRTVGSQSGAAYALNSLGLLALQTGATDRARARFAASATIRLQLGEAWTLAYSLAGLAVTEMTTLAAAELGSPVDPERQRRAAAMAARLIGATEQLLAQVEGRLSSIYGATVSATIARAQAILGPDAFGAAYAEGQAVPPEALLQALG